MEINPVFFYIFAAIAIGCSLLVVLKKNPVASAFSLVLVFFSFAAIYAQLDAHLLAALQILVYAGAIMVLFIFVIMLLNQDTPSFDLVRSHMGLKIGAVICTAALFAAFVWSFQHTAAPTPIGNFTPENIEAAGGNTRVLSELLFSDYLLPFELTSVLLLSSMIGAVAIAKRKLGYSVPTPEDFKLKSGLQPGGLKVTFGPESSAVAAPRATKSAVVAEAPSATLSEEGTR